MGVNPRAALVIRVIAEAHVLALAAHLAADSRELLDLLVPARSWTARELNRVRYQAGRVEQEATCLVRVAAILGTNQEEWRVFRRLAGVANGRLLHELSGEEAQRELADNLFATRVH